MHRKVYLKIYTCYNRIIYKTSKANLLKSLFRSFFLLQLWIKYKNSNWLPFRLAVKKPMKKVIETTSREERTDDSSGSVISIWTVYNPPSLKNYPINFEFNFFAGRKTIHTKTDKNIHQKAVYKNVLHWM